MDAVRRIVAIQAQEPPSPFIALWNRVDGFDPADLDRALATQQIVKATLMRITLHAVAADDYPAIHEAMQRVAACGAAERPALPVRERPDRGGRGARAGSAAVHERRRAETRTWRPGSRTGSASPKPRVWWALRQYGPIVHATTGGPWAFGPRPAYVGANDQARPGDPAASVQRLVRRYLEGFGPATMPDIAQFSTIVRPPIQEALAELGDELERHEGPAGAVLYDVPGGPLPDEDTPAPPRLMAMWDSTLLAYADRARMMPPAYRKLVIRTNGDVLPTILVDGLVAGVWRPLDDGIEVDGVPSTVRPTRLERPRAGGARAPGVPRRAGADRLPALRPLVGRPPEGDGSAPRLSPACDRRRGVSPPAAPRSPSRVSGRSRYSRTQASLSARSASVPATSQRRQPSSRMCVSWAIAIEKSVGVSTRPGPPASAYASRIARARGGSSPAYSTRTQASSCDGSARPALSKSKTHRPPPGVRRTLSAQRSRWQVRSGPRRPDHPGVQGDELRHERRPARRRTGRERRGAGGPTRARRARRPASAYQSSSGAVPSNGTRCSRATSEPSATASRSSAGAARSTHDWTRT